MPQFTKVTPNLVVDDVERSLRFYEQVLGFARAFHVPDQPPFVFVCVASGAVQIFLNDRREVAKALPEHAQRIGATMGNQLFIEMESGIEAWWERVKDRAPVIMPLVTQWYGMKEFAVADPDGYVTVFAERVQS